MIDEAIIEPRTTNHEPHPFCELNHKPQSNQTSHDSPTFLTSSNNRHYESFEREKLDAVYDRIAPYSAMDEHERYFMNGMIRSLKPKKVLEAGVFDGGGTAIILNAISDIEGAMLYSLEYREKSITHIGKPSGFIAEDQFPELTDKWKIFRGGDISRHIEAVAGDIDLLVLDTAHIHPWETLNFLCILPFMKKDSSWTILHDINLYARPNSRICMACCYLFSHVVSDDKFTPFPEEDDKDIKFSNIGAFRVSDITEKYVNNLFLSLTIPWGIKISAGDLADVEKIIRKYYSPEQYKFFCDVIELQEYMFNAHESFGHKFKDSIKKMLGKNITESIVRVKRTAKRFVGLDAH